MSQVRTYKDADYQALIALYKDSSTFGGQYDAARDGNEKIRAVTANDPEAILVYEEAGSILGTVSLIEDGRVAWLFRFCVRKTPQENVVARSLYHEAVSILRARGHTQVLVYSDPNNESLNQRYQKLAMIEGSIYKCFWQDISK